MALLEITNLHVALEDGTEIVKGVDLALDMFPFTELTQPW